MRKLICSLLLLVGLCTPVFGTNFFTWSANSAVTPRGTCNFINAVIDPTGGHDGSGAMRYNVPDGGDGQRGCTDLGTGDIGAGSWLSGKTIYYRWWMKVDPSFSWGNRKFFKLGRMTDGGSDNISTYLQNNLISVDGPTGNCPGGGGCGNISYAFDGAAAKNYQEYILAITLQTTSGGTGGAQLFVNGSSVGSFTHNLYNCSLGCGAVGAASWGNAMGQALYSQLCLGGSACGSGGPIWVDDMSVDDVWNSNFSGGPPDTTAPTAPTNLSGVAAGSTAINLTWTASTDAVGVTGYRVERCTGSGCSNFAQIGTPSSNSYPDTGLTASTTYQYRVRATDLAGNLSSYSTTASAATSAGGVASECPSNWKALNPAWIWCDDFETDKIASYFDNDSPVLLVRTAGVGFNGSFGRAATWTSGLSNAGSLKLAFGLVPSGAGMNIPSGVDTTTKFQEIYYRAYLKSQTGWVSGANSASKYTRATEITASNWSEAMVAHLWSSGTNNNFLGIDPATCVTGSTVNCVGYNDFSHLVFIGAATGTTALFTSPNAGNWNCIEAHVKLNTSGNSNGIQEFWVDGILQTSRTNLNFVGSYTGFGLNAIFFENYINNGSPQAQSRWWDNIVVSTARIGCLGGSAPPTPTGFRRIPKN